MRILALDPGSSCGFAVGDPAGVLVSGVWQLTPGRGDSPGMRYVRLRGYLEDVLRAYPDLALVVYEQAHHRGGAATEYAVGCATTVQTWCAERGIDHSAVHSATVKKWATGRGNAKKAEMVRLARERFQPTTSTDDEIDALWMLDWARAQWVGSAPVGGAA